MSQVTLEPKYLTARQVANIKKEYGIDLREEANALFDNLREAMAVAKKEGEDLDEVAAGIRLEMDESAMLDILGMAYPEDTQNLDRMRPFELNNLFNAVFLETFGGGTEKKS